MAQYTQRTQPMHSHVAWLQQNIKQQIIALDDTITICQLHLDFGKGMISQPQPVIISQPTPPVPEIIRPTETNSVQITSKKSGNLNKVSKPPAPATRTSKLYTLLSEPSTSKSKTTYEQVYENTCSDLELYNNSDIERQVVDIETSVSRSTNVIEKRPMLETCQVPPKRRNVTQKRHKVAEDTFCAHKVAQEKQNISQEVQVISDDDDDVVEIKTESIPITFEEIDDDQTRSSDDNVTDHIADNEIVLIDGNSIFRTTISIDKPVHEEPVTEEQEDKGGNEEEMVLPDVNIPKTYDPLKIELEPVKIEPKDEISDIEDQIAYLEGGEAEFEDEGPEFEHIKVESPNNTIDIGETVIQAVPVSNYTLDELFSTLVDKKFITVADRNHLSTIKFDTDCISNETYISNDNIKEFARELYFCSEEAYNFMANYISCLPTVAYIKETFITRNGEPGFSMETLACLKMRVKQKKTSKNLLCSLAINDIELKASGKFKTHRVAFIITAVALNASWKLPICYFITQDLLNSKKRVQMILLAISLIEKSGVIPKAVSYLPIFQNIEMAEMLVKNKKNKSKFTALSGKAIYLIPDPVYIFDTFKICACEDMEQKFISLKHIELLVKYLGKVRPGKMTNRLLGKSLTFSLEVCTADFLSSGLANVNGTVRYLKLINTFLDIMTSHPGGTSWKAAVSRKNLKKVTMFLENFENYISNLSPKYKSNPFWLNNTAQGKLKFDTRSIIDVLSMAVFSAQALIQELIGLLSYSELSMKKLTMNSTAFLANFHHVVNNGEMTEMTAEEFTARYKKNLQYMEPHPAIRGYILPIENVSVLDVTSPVQRINVTTYLLNSNHMIKTRQYQKYITDDLYKIIRFDARGEYSNLSKIYIAGYVVYNLVRRLRCDTCISALLRSNQRQGDDDPYNSELVIQKTEQDSSSKLCIKLMDPSVDVVRICKATDAVFKQVMAQSEAEKLDILKRFSVPILMMKIRKNMVGKDFFKGLDFHRHDTDMLENHVVELAKAVAEVYLQMRLKYRALY